MNTPKQRLNWGGNQEAQQQADAAFGKLRNKRKKPRNRKQRRADARKKAQSNYQQHPSLVRPASKPKAKAKPFVDYKVYIKSRAWFTKRSEALARAEFRCERCQSTRNLHVHHKTYARLGNELPSDLEVLCKECHADHHLTEVLGRLA